MWWDDDPDWLPVEEAARRLGLSKAEVKRRVRDGVLRSRYVYGALEVQCALVSGWLGGPPR